MSQKFEDKSTKPDYTFIPIEALTREALNMQRGLKLGRKKGDWKIEAENNIERYKSSLLRHTLQYIHGDDSEDHLAAIRCNAAIIMWYEERSM